MRIIEPFAIKTAHRIVSPQITKTHRPTDNVHELKLVGHARRVTIWKAQ
jgi:hypothetical protein